MAANVTRHAASHLLPKAPDLPAGSLVGVVVSAGKMQRTVKVRTTKQKFNSYLKRHYQEHPTFMTSDPRDSLREGDVVRIAPWKKAEKITHIVTDLMVPFGPPAKERPAVLGLDKLIKLKGEKHKIRWDARQARRKVETEERENSTKTSTAGQQQQGMDMGKKIAQLREAALRHEVEAERIAEHAAEDTGIDPNKSMDNARLRSYDSSV